MKRAGRALLAALFVSATANAREGWDADTYVPPDAGSRWFVLDSIDLRGHGRMALALTTSYAYRPVVVRDPSNDAPTSVVRNEVMSHASAAFVFERVRLGFDVPFQILSEGHDATAAGIVHAAPRDQNVVGDVRLSADVRLFGEGERGWTGALGSQLYVPAGETTAYTGDGDPHFRGRFELAYSAARAAAAFDAGMHVRGREEDWAHGHIGSEAFVHAAYGLLFARRTIIAGPELSASTVVTKGVFARENTPVEVLAGVHWDVLPELRLGAAAGVALTEAYGAGVFRGIFNIAWVPPIPAPPKAKTDDRDGDGVKDADDACGFVPGVRSPFAERNGCPAPEEPAPAVPPSPPDPPRDPR